MPRRFEFDSGESVPFQCVRKRGDGQLPRRQRHLCESHKRGPRRRDHCPFTWQLFHGECVNVGTSLNFARRPSTTRSACPASSGGAIFGPLGIQVACATQALGPCSDGTASSVLGQIRALAKALKGDLAQLENPDLSQMKASYPAPSAPSADLPDPQPPMNQPCAGYARTRGVHSRGLVWGPSRGFVLGSGSDTNAGVPTGRTTTGRRIDAGEVNAARREHPGGDGIRVPHLTAPQFVSTPGHRRHRRQRVDDSPALIRVISHTDRAGNGQGEVRNGAVPPAPDLVSEQAESIGSSEADRTLGNDTALFAVCVGDRSLLDGVAAFRQSDDERRMIEIAGWPMLHLRGEPLEEFSAQSDNARTGTKGDPVEIRGATSGHVRPGSGADSPRRDWRRSMVANTTMRMPIAPTAVCNPGEVTTHAASRVTHATRPAPTHR